MANANVARGLIPVRHRNGAPYNGGGNVYYVPSSDGTALYIGDPVIVVTSSADAFGVPTVTRATAAGGNYISGVMLGCVSNAGETIVARTQDKPVYRVASTEAYVLIADDPDLIFEIQEDSVGGNMGVGASGAGSRNVDLISGSGSTTSGFSGFMADSSTLATTNTLQLRVMRPAPKPDNDPTSADSLAKWLVAINLHSSRNLTGV